MEGLVLASGKEIVCSQIRDEVDDVFQSTAGEGSRVCQTLREIRGTEAELTSQRRGGREARLNLNFRRIFYNRF
jgi:hypothetical protein